MFPIPKKCHVETARQNRDFGFQKRIFMCCIKNSPNWCFFHLFDKTNEIMIARVWFGKICNLSFRNRQKERGGNARKWDGWCLHLRKSASETLGEGPRFSLMMQEINFIWRKNCMTLHLWASSRHCHQTCCRRGWSKSSLFHVSSGSIRPFHLDCPIWIESDLTDALCKLNHNFSIWVAVWLPKISCPNVIGTNAILVSVRPCWSSDSDCALIYRDVFFFLLDCTSLHSSGPPRKVQRQNCAFFSSKNATKTEKGTSLILQMPGVPNRFLNSEPGVKPHPCVVVSENKRQKKKKKKKKKLKK